MQIFSRQMIHASGYPRRNTHTPADGKLGILMWVGAGGWWLEKSRWEGHLSLKILPQGDF